MVNGFQPAHRFFRRLLWRLGLLLWLAAYAPAQEDLAGRVLVVYNQNSSASAQVAEHYLTRRRIPRRNLCAIAPAAMDELSWDAFNSTVKTPVRNCLNAIDPARRILYIVLSFDTPFRVNAGVPAQYYHPQGQSSATPGRAVDSYLIDLWEGYAIRENPYAVNADTKNNVYQTFESLADFNQRGAGPPVYSVWRLDGPTPDIAQGLVDKAIYAETYGLSGRACFDRNRGLFNVLQETDASYLATDWDMYRAAEFAREMGWDTQEDFVEAEFGASPAPARCDGAAFYTGWYSYNNYNDAFSWTPGAIGFHIDSASAFNPRGGTNWAANALRRGITVTSGAVEEPFVRLFPKTDQVLRYLLQGANVGDAFLRSSLFKDWQFINLGDPLYRPFPQSVFPPAAGVLPRGWRHAAIGANASAQYFNGHFELQSNGAGLTGTADTTGFAYTVLRGDGELTARVSRPENTSGGGAFPFAGLMLRENLTPQAPYLALGVAAGEGYQLARREASGQAGAVLQRAEIGAQLWVRLARYGNRVNGYMSPDGKEWTEIGTLTTNLPPTLYAGLALSSGASERVNKSFFDNVMVRTKPRRSVYGVKSLTSGRESFSLAGK
jgi:uncharacterized protein (TIGR03790 family)